MKRLCFFLLLQAGFMPISIAQNRGLPAYERDWSRADSLMAKGLPKSALAIATRIYTEAKATRNYPQVAKAAMHRMIFRSYADENAYVELVRSIQGDIRDTPEPARSVLQSVLAEMYWQYFQQNRYKFYDRSVMGRPATGRSGGKIAPGNTGTGKVSNGPEKNAPATDSTVDFTTWDARQLVEATTAAFLSSVTNQQILQKTPLAEYDALLDKGDPDTRPLRPTLYDLLAHRAIGFFQNTEPDLLKPVFKFELDQPGYFAATDAFVKQPVLSRDSLSGRYQALHLYQKLLQFHLADNQADALADVDGLRLAFVYRYNIVPNRDTLYRQALSEQIARYKNQPDEAIYGYLLATFLTDHAEVIRPVDGEEGPGSEPLQPGPSRWYRKQAADICRDLVKRFPKTLSGRQAAVLLNQLLISTYSFQVEDVNMPGQPFRALVTYQNVRRLHYRVIRLSMSEMVTGLTLRNQFRSDEQGKQLLKAWLKREKTSENAVDLPDDSDLNTHSVEIPLAALPMGQYVLLTTTEGTFSEDSGSVQYTTFTVSSLGYVVQNTTDTRQQLLVTNRQTGEPLPAATVGVVEENAKLVVNDRRIYKTNAQGQVSVPSVDIPKAQSYRYLITVGSDSLLSNSQYRYNYYSNSNEEQVATHTQLFTDRAIYRPGQPIYVKGLVYEGKNNQFAVAAERQMKIELLDHNGERITEKTLKTNEFGTFVTDFTAPVGRLTGAMILQTAFGQTTIRVEEYKRPTFEVIAKPIRQSFKLDQTVTATAQAKTFAGAVVDGAEVRYRVVRTERQRWYWWYRQRPANQAEIANGTAQTDAQGNVKITFPATPDYSKSRSDNPIFDFSVTFDVIDRAGETRSTTQNLRIGYSAIQAELIIPAQIEKGEKPTFPLRITNQSGQRVRATGNVTVYRLQPPARPLRSRLWQRPDRYLLSRADFEQQFPNDLFANENSPLAWPKGDVVQQQTITTPADSLIRPELEKYPPGEYVAEVTVTDSTGEKASTRTFFAVVDDKVPTASARADAWVQVRKATAEPGESAVFWVGNSLPGWVMMTVEENHLVVRQEWLKTDGRPRRIVLPVTEKQRGGFAVHFMMVQNGRLYQQSQIVTVPFTNKQLRIETQTFRSKLKPGQKEEWTLTIAGLNKTPAELVATLYDASLDAFDVLNWPESFYNPYYSILGNWQSGCFDVQSSIRLNNRYQPDLSVPTRQYDQLGWMGYRFSPYGNQPFRPKPIRQPLGIVNGPLQIKIKRSGKVISGTVKNKDGSAAAGVNVVLKGTKNGSTTNTDGSFSIKTDSESKVETLTFSFIGYVTQEVVVAKKAVSRTMPPSQQELSEVVVTGYNTQAKRELTGAAAKVSLGGAVAYQQRVLAESAVSPAPMQDGNGAGVDKTGQQPVDAPINPRRNFNETAFFLPQLKTDEQGRVVLKFTMPEALTRWRLLAFAHTKDLKIGTLERSIVTQKELMITTNAPRFLREGDTIRIAARVNNLSDKSLSGVAKLTLSDAITGEPVNLFGSSSMAEQPSFSLAAGQSQSISWTLFVPAGLQPVIFRVTAQSGSFTDGEEFTIPVLPNRMLITDTQPFWVNGVGAGSTATKTFKLKELTNLNPELPVQHERLTVEVTSNPSWYALQSLPYLMEYRYECAEQLFCRLYANSLAAHIVASKPSFNAIIAEWQKMPLKSPLQSNEELKSVTIENTPWLVDARSETARQARLGQLLDKNRMATEQQQAFERLLQLQASGGGFRWFGGMQPSLSMTLHILAGFGHLEKLGVTFPSEMQQAIADMETNAIRYVDAEMKEYMLRETQQKIAYLSPFWATQYLYARSFYLNKPVDKTVLTYVTKQLAANWLNQSLQGQALSALSLNRFGDSKTASGILASLRERARNSDELGMYWPDNQSGLFWYQTPVETQAYLIEAFDEISNDRTTVDNMKRWLLRQKQTQSWSSTKATTEAIYALLLRGSDWLDTKSNTQVSLGGQSIENRVTQTEIATGYQKVTYAASEIKSTMGVIDITKKGEGPAWGALYWQHFEPLDRVMPSNIDGSGGGLSIQKTLFVQHDSPNGPVITPVASETSLKPGDIIKVRLVLKNDRLMEYVHLKDSRASGFEPVAALSGYKFQNGLGYYESPRDASTDFFLEYLPVGTHVFEYDLRVAQTGDFSAGVATVQCFYAPEFSAHSAGIRVRVK